MRGKLAGYDLPGPPIEVSNSHVANKSIFPIYALPPYYYLLTWIRTTSQVDTSRKREKSCNTASKRPGISFGFGLRSSQRSQVTKMRYQNMPVECQRVLRADVPAVNRFKGTSSSKKVTQDHEIVRKIGKRADNQHETSAIFTMRLENLYKRGARIC